MSLSYQTTDTSTASVRPVPIQAHWISNSIAACLVVMLKLLLL